MVRQVLIVMAGCVLLGAHATAQTVKPEGQVPPMREAAIVPGAPLRVRELLNANAPGTLVTPAVPLHDVVVAGAPVVNLRADTVPPCAGASPKECPGVPTVTGFAAAGALDGQVLIVRNTGAGLLALEGEGAGSAALNRLTTSRLLPPGEVAVLVYDAARARWDVLGGATGADIPGPSGVRR